MQYAYKVVRVAYGYIVCIKGSVHVQPRLFLCPLCSL